MRGLAGGTGSWSGRRALLLLTGTVSCVLHAHTAASAPLLGPRDLQDERASQPAAGGGDFELLAPEGKGMLSIVVLLRPAAESGSVLDDQFNHALTNTHRSCARRVQWSSSYSTLNC